MKYYSVEEAQRTLSEVMPLIAELVDLKKELDRRGFDVYKHRYFGGMGPNGQKVFPPQMERLVEIVQQLGERSIEVKDLGKGLIDFHHRRKNGDHVYLCYLFGEAEIAYWHDLEGGFRGRQPLSAL